MFIGASPPPPIFLFGPITTYPREGCQKHSNSIMGVTRIRPATNVFFRFFHTTLSIALSALFAPIFH